MVSLAEQVHHNICRRRLIGPGQRVLVAVSGGVDSMVLLHLLYELARSSGWKLTIAHLNHQLRGAGSLADERLVRRTAHGLHLPIVVSRANVRSYAKARGLSLEMAARKLRHDFLARAARARRIACIALAHHAGDQVELFFLRLLRGSGSSGLAGMKWSNPSPGDRAITLVRPLLNCSKAALIQYAAERKIDYREDASNNSLDIQRNRVRHELLPLLQRHYQAGLAKNVARVMEILASESDFVHTVAASWLAGQPNAAAGSPDISTAGLSFAEGTVSLLHPGFERVPFESLPVAVQRRCVQLDLIGLGVMPEYDLVELLRLHPDRPIEVGASCLLPAAPAKADSFKNPGPAASPGPLRVIRQQSGRLALAPQFNGAFLAQRYSLDLTGRRGNLEWDGCRLEWRILTAKTRRRTDRGLQTELFDADAVGSRIILRHWRPGDRFQPIGMSGTVKLQDLFVNQKVPRQTRRALAVATTAGGEVFWVEGLRISERFKLTDSTIRRLLWAWQRL